MPEKVSSITPAPTISFGARYGMAVNFNPDLSLQAMRALTEWSWLEHIVMRLFIRMLGADPRPGAAMYSALSSTASQKAALRAVVGTFSDAHAQVFEVLLVLFGSIGKDRNKIAHWMWGCAPSIPDAILLADPVAMTEFEAAKTHAEQAGLPLPDYPRDDVYVWKERDFDSITIRIEALLWHLARFEVAITPGPHSDEALQKLSDEPEIRERLDRQRQRRKIDPAE